ncbi:MAG: tape measure protein [Sulfurovum sp.]
MATIGTVTIVVDSDVARLIEGVQRSTTQMTRLQRETRNAQREINNFIRTFASMGAVTYAVTSASHAMFDLADEATNINSKLKLVSDTTDELTASKEALFNISQKNRVAFGATVDVFKNMSMSTDVLNLSNKTLLETTDNISKSILISSSSAESAKAGLTQLGQAFSADFKSVGQELASVREQTPRLYTAMVVGLGVTRDEFRQMAKEGRLSSEMIIKAISSQGAVLDKEFANMALTVGQSNTLVANSFLMLVGDIDKSIGASESFANVLVGLSNILDGSSETAIHLAYTLGGFIASSLIISGVSKAFTMLRVSMVASAQTALLHQRLAQMNGVTISLMGARASIARTQIIALGTSLKTMALANAPLLVMMGIFETWNYIRGKTAEQEEKITKIMGLQAVELQKVSAIQNLDNINKLKEQLEIQQEMVRVDTIKVKRLGFQVEANDKELISKKALLDVEIQVQDKLENQINLIQSIVDGTYQATTQTDSLSNSAYTVTSNLASATAQANSLALALLQANNALGVAMASHDVLMGKISEATATAKNDTNSIVLARESLLDVETNLTNLGVKYANATSVESKKTILLDIEKQRVSYAKTQTTLQNNINTQIVNQNKNYTDTLNLEKRKQELVIKTANVNKTDAVSQAKTALALAKSNANFIQMGTLIGNTAKGSLEETKKSLLVGEANLEVKNAELLLSKTITDEAKAGVKAKSASAKVGAKANKAQQKAIKDTQNAYKEYIKATKLDTPELGKNIINPFEELIESQKEYMKNLKNSGKDIAKIERANAKYTQEKISGYADISKGMQSMFQDGTTGYNAMGAVQSTLQAFELAWYIKKQLFEETGLATQLASIFTSTTATVAGEATKSTALGVNAVLTQAGGDPYTAWARMAAMAAMVAGLGVAVSGGGGSGATMDDFSKIEARTDSDNKSLENSINLLADIDKSQLEYAKKMSESLDKMNDNFLRMGLDIAKSQGIDYTGSAYIGSTSENLWGGKTTSLEGAGLQFDTTNFKDALTDMEIFSYQTVKTIKESWFGLSTSTSVATNFTKAGDDLTNAFIESIGYGVDTIETAMLGLDLDSDILNKALENTEFDIGKISLEGKSGDEISSFLSALLGEQLDKLSETTFASLDGFNHIGEGYLETAIRVSSGVEMGTKAMDKLGIAMVDYSFISDKQGDVYTELIRDSIVSYQDTSVGISEIISGLDESGDELISIYSKLEDTQALLRHLSNTYTDVTQSMIDGAGDIDILSSALDSYRTNFLSADEQFLLQRKELSEEFESLGLSLPKTTQAYIDLLNAQDLTTDSGQELYGSLIVLNDGMKTFFDSNEERLTDINDKYDSLNQENNANFITQIENLIDFENEKTKIIRDSQTAILSSFSTLKEKTQSFLDSWAGGAETDEMSYKFYAQRYNSLKSEMSNFVDENGNVKSGIDYSVFEDTYSSLQTVANNLKDSSSSNPMLDVSTSIINDMDKYLDIFTNQEDVMKVIIAGDELGLARDEKVGDLATILDDVKTLSGDGNLTSDYINQSIIELMGISQELGKDNSFISLGNAMVSFNDSMLTSIYEQSLSLDTQRTDEINTATQEPIVLTKWVKPSVSQPTPTVNNWQQDLNNSFIDRVVVDDFRYFADGGIVSRPTLGMVGEAGYPEAIIPMRNGRDVPVSINNSKLEKKFDDLIYITTQQAQEIQRMRKEIQDMNERSA